MSTDVIGICVTILGSVVLSGIAIAIAVFLGLRSTVNPIGDKISALKDDIVTELSGIKERIIKIEGVADNIWGFIGGYLQRSEGTIIRDLKNFGKTKISVQPEARQTIYTIRVERGRLAGTMVDKLSKITDLEKTENELFMGNPVEVTSYGSDMLRVTIPSTDSALCTKYMSIFLKWLDTKYIELLKSETSLFEDDIEV